MTAGAPHICLIGGGHAHVAVLADWIENGVPGAGATLLTPHKTLRYSGMVPGWISGQYERDEGLVDLAGLAAQAGIDFVLDRCIGIDSAANKAASEGGVEIAFDIASIDTGGVGRARKVLGDDPRLLDIRPIDRFVRQIDGVKSPGRIAVVGGGAGGVELAFALCNRDNATAAREVVLVAGSEGLAPDFSDGVRDAIAEEFARQGVVVIAEDAKIEDGDLLAGGQSVEPLECIVATLGSDAPSWPRESGLACDTRGFIAVDAYQRSTSHPHIFAVGDIAARQDRHVPHSGVHAVHAGPVLAANIRSLAKGEEPNATYRPRRYSLYLLSTGNGSAIASYGPFRASGRWVARLKHWIDTRWIEKYARLAKKGV